MKSRIEMKKILLVAGGGGHTGHAYIFAQKLVERYDLSFIIPRGDKYSRLKLWKLGEIYEVEKPFQPTSTYSENLYKLVKAFIDSIRIPWKKHGLVICFGSNHCIAPIVTAKLHGLKTILVESPMRVVSQSKTYKYLKYFADYILVSWREQLRYYPLGKTLVIGPYYEEPRYKPYDGDYILVTTGTYGFPELVEAVLKLPLEKAVIQTGRDDPVKYRVRKPEWIFFDYDPDLGRWIAGASIVISHLGRVVIDSIYAYCKPVIIIPNPRWVKGATIRDAVMIAYKTGSVLLPSPYRLTINIVREAMNRKEAFLEKCRTTENGVLKALALINKIMHHESS